MEHRAVAALAETIAAHLALGLAQDAATARCLASSLGPLSAAELAARLADGDDLEAAPLRELLLFPGRDTSLALEPALAAADLAPADLQALTACLAGAVRHVRVRLPGQAPIDLPVAATDIDLFVDRLRPAHTPPASIRQTLAARFPAPLARELAVDCRLAALPWPPSHRAFLETLLGRIDPAGSDAPDLVRFALRLFAQLAPDEPPLTALSQYRETLLSQYHRARLQEQSLAASNFETLLATGARLPHLHAPDLARDLALADAMLVALTGRTGGGEPPAERDLGAVDDVAGFMDAFGRLGDGPSGERS